MAPYHCWGVGSPMTKNVEVLGLGSRPSTGTADMFKSIVVRPRKKNLDVTHFPAGNETGGDELIVFPGKEMKAGGVIN